MMKIDENIRVVKRWNTSAFGVIADLQHHLDGLESGCTIESVKEGKQWRVKNRVLCSTTAGNQKIFPNEQINHFFLGFESIEQRERTSKRILEPEEQSVFQYQLDPVGHDSAPDVGDSLCLLRLSMHGRKVVNNNRNSAQPITIHV